MLYLSWKNSHHTSCFLSFYLTSSLYIFISLPLFITALFSHISQSFLFLLFPLSVKLSIFQCSLFPESFLVCSLLPFLFSISHFSLSFNYSNKFSRFLCLLTFTLFLLLSLTLFLFQLIWISFFHISLFQILYFFSFNFTISVFFSFYLSFFC